MYGVGECVWVCMGDMLGVVWRYACLAGVCVVWWPRILIGVGCGGP